MLYLFLCHSTGGSTNCHSDTVHVRKFRPAIINDGKKYKDGIDIVKTPSPSKGTSLQLQLHSLPGQDIQSKRVYGFVENGVFTMQKMPVFTPKASDSLSSTKKHLPDSIPSDILLCTSPDKKPKREFVQGSSKHNGRKVLNFIEKKRWAEGRENMTIDIIDISSDYK